MLDYCARIHNGEIPDTSKSVNHTHRHYLNASTHCNGFVNVRRSMLQVDGRKATLL